MSYNATISFKTISEGELFDFFTKMKKSCVENLKDIAKENFCLFKQERREKNPINIS
jgi:hypothetical protein